MVKQFEHLSDAQIEHYGTDSITSISGEAQRIEAHLEDCADCRARLLDYQRANFSLLTDAAMQASPNAGSCSEGGSGTRNCGYSGFASVAGGVCPSPNGPSEDDLRNLAAGLIARDRAPAVTQHAAQCAHCGPLLRAFAEDFSDDQSSDELKAENEALAQLKSSTPKWQKEIAGQAVKANRDRSSIQHLEERPHRWSMRWILVPASVAVCALIAFGAWYSQRETPEKVEKLLARAYTEQRTMEMRIPGAAHADLTLLRATETSRLDVPEPLIHAELIISHHLSERDVKWLRLKGVSDLLEGRYETAINTLIASRNLSPPDPSLDVELAIAYFQRAQALDHPSDYGTAIDLLGQALQLAPDNSLAVFNRAIAEERLYMYGEAYRDWERYLQQDPQGAWAEEARSRLQKLKTKLAEHSSRVDEPLLSPEEFDRVFQSAIDHAVPLQVSARAEAYLDVAIREWLPEACTENHERRNPAVSSALNDLATLLTTHSGDPWLRDVLLAHKSKTFCDGVNALAQAIHSNVEGDSAGAGSQALVAASSFRSAGAEAALLRAQLENVYALHRGVHASECLSLARRIEPEIKSKNYRWAQIQLYLEESSCDDLLSRFSDSERLMNDALNLAKSADFTTLCLRAQGFIAEVELVKGNTARSWTVHLAALKDYWTAAAPPIRAFQLYGGLSLMAEDNGQWHLEEGLLNEAITAVKSAGSLANESLAHYRLGETFAALNDVSQAGHQYQEAKRLLETLPQNPVTKYYRVLAEIGNAKIEAQRDPQSARSHLESARNFLNASDAITCLDFYRTVGAIKLKQGQITSAEDDLTTGSRFAERALSNITSERDRTAWMRGADDIYRALTDLELQKGQARRALLTWEWYRGSALRINQATSLSHQRADPLEELDHLIDSTDPETIVLIYASFQQRSTIWVVKDRVVYPVTVGIGSDQLRRMANRFEDLCSNPQAPMALIEQLGRELYGVLIAPVASYFSDDRTRLVFELDKSIGSLPISALVEPSGTFFGEHHAIAISPGLMYRHRMRPPSKNFESNRALVISQPAINMTGREFQPLPNVVLEVDAIAHQFPLSTVLTGRSATVDAFRKALPNAGIVHFAGHSSPDDDTVKLLLLGEQEGSGSRLQAQTLIRGLRKCNLVVLSACSTERSQTGWITMDGLVFTLLNSGLPDVVATRWNIDSKATSSFMNAFYVSLRKHNTPSRALQSAVTALRKNAATRHPFYWAAFIDFSRS